MADRDTTFRESQDRQREHEERVIRNDRFGEWRTAAEIEELARLEAIRQRRKSHGTPSEL